MAKEVLIQLGPQVPRVREGELVHRVRSVSCIFVSFLPSSTLPICPAGEGFAGWRLIVTSPLPPSSLRAAAYIAGLVLRRNSRKNSGEGEGVHDPGEEEVVSAICYTIYTIYLSLCTQTAETTSPETFSWIPCRSGMYLRKTRPLGSLICTSSSTPPPVTGPTIPDPGPNNIKTHFSFEHNIHILRRQQTVEGGGEAIYVIFVYKFPRAWSTLPPVMVYHNSLFVL